MTPDLTDSEMESLINRVAHEIDWWDYTDLVLQERMVAQALSDLDVPERAQAYAEGLLSEGLRQWVLDRQED